MTAQQTSGVAIAVPNTNLALGKIPSTTQGNPGLILEKVKVEFGPSAKTALVAPQVPQALADATVATRFALAPSVPSPVRLKIAKSRQEPALATGENLARVAVSGETFGQVEEAAENPGYALPNTGGEQPGAAAGLVIRSPIPEEKQEFASAFKGIESLKAPALQTSAGIDSPALSAAAPVAAAAVSAARPIAPKQEAEPSRLVQPAPSLATAPGSKTLMPAMIAQPPKAPPVAQPNRARPATPSKVETATRLVQSAANLPGYGSTRVLAPQLAPKSTKTEPVRLLDSAQFKHFDLAKTRGSSRSQGAGLAQPRKAPTPIVQSGRVADSLVGNDVVHQTKITINGYANGEIPVRIGEDMKPSVRLGDLLGLVSHQMDPNTAGRFTAAAAASEYVSFATLRSAGFDVRYDPAADKVSIEVPQK